MLYGLGEQTINKIRSVFAAHPSIEKAVLYGSRAKGNYKPGSDIDLTLYGDTLTSRELGDIVEELDDLLLPYQIDLSLFSQIEHVKLKDHIERVGVVFYQSIGEEDSARAVDCGTCGDAGKGLGRAVKNEWRVNTLGEVCSFLNRGVAPKYTENGGVCVLNQKCIRNHKIDLGPSRRHDDQSKKVTKEKFIRTGDVLVNSTGTGTLGRVAQLREALAERTTVDSHVTIVRPQQGKFYTDFFGYMLIFIEGLIKDSGEGCGGQTELPRATLSEKFLVQYPESIEEQKRIVTILDDAFESIDTAIANTEKNIANAKKLFDSYLNKVFFEAGQDWISTRLGDTCKIKHGFAFKSEYFRKSGGYVLLTPGSFYESGGFRDQGEKTKYYDGPIPEGFVLQEGDFLVAMTEQAVGLLGSALVVPESNKYLHNQRLGLVEQTGRFDWSNAFFLHLFKTSSFRNAVQSSASGVKVRHTSPGKLEEIVVKFPESKLCQNQIAAKLDEVEAACGSNVNTYMSKLNLLHEFKQSLLQKAFSGELPTDFNPDALEH